MDAIQQAITNENETLEVLADELAYLKPIPQNVISPVKSSSNQA
jgi:hypothetical protein